MSSLRVDQNSALDQFLGRTKAYLGGIFQSNRSASMNTLHVEEMTDRQMSDIGLTDGRYEKPQTKGQTAFDAARRHFIGRGL